jgi:hypothetical protein
MRLVDADRAPTAWGGALVLALVVLPLYLLTMVEAAEVNQDTDPAALPAWNLVQHGTMDLQDVTFDDNPFIFPTDAGRVMSDRPPGLSLLAVPAYLLTGDDTYSPDPSTVTAALITFAAVLVMHAALRRCAPPWWALGGALTFGLALATWPISAGQLWPHGPGQLLFACAVLALAGQRYVPAGVAFGLEVLVRPVAIVAPTALAALELVRRHWRRAVTLLAPAAVGLVAIVLYNDWAFGTPSISGGYGSHFRERFTDQSAWGYVKNASAMLGSPKNGLLVWSPVVLFALLGVRRAWGAMPGWARDAAIAALVYLLVHPRINRASGGLPYDYRYPLEALTLACPALVLSARAALQGAEWRTRALVLALSASLLLQGLVAFTYDCDTIVEDELAECSLL